MAIEQVSREDVLTTCHENLGIPITPGNMIDDAFLAALLRRTAGIMCPCSPATIVASALDALQSLVDDKAATVERLNLLAEKLLITGDFLELNQVTTDDSAVRGTWVFAAPPSFVERPDGSVFLLGIVPDDATPLPASLACRVVYEGLLRVLRPNSSENLRSVLSEMGWLELSRTAWLKAPKPTTAAEMLDGMLRRLEEQPPSGVILEAQILDPARETWSYARRWVLPTNQTGNYVARRPQAHGAPLWGFAALANGAITKFLDFPLRGARWRGCDVAWQLQMAIDDRVGTPQTYRRRAATNGVLLDFFSPLPLWAERRLAVLGQPAPRQACLFTYWIPQQELAIEEKFLREHLWLSHHENGERETA
jgi:hypothetical protein